MNVRTYSPIPLHQGYQVLCARRVEPSHVLYKIKKKEIYTNKAKLKLKKKEQTIKENSEIDRIISSIISS